MLLNKVAIEAKPENTSIALLDMAERATGTCRRKGDRIRKKSDAQYIMNVTLILNVLHVDLPSRTMFSLDAATKTPVFMYYPGKILC